MRIENQQVQLAASDLAKHLACRHLTMLDLLGAQDEIKRPYWEDPSVDALIERGFRHEAAYLAHLKEQGLEVLAHEEGLQRTLDAMRAGVAVIAQADLKAGRWFGRADVLLKVDKPSRLGNWSYEVVDTKLARETRGGTILQLCLYSELIENIQGVMPERMHVVTPGRGFQPESFRPHDFLAYYRFVKARLERVIAAETNLPTYPDPVEHCEICHWWPLCNDRRRKDDHLSFVSGISKRQRSDLRDLGITTLASLARSAPDGFVKIREQARLQLESRDTGKPVHELLAPEPERGLARLPEPSPGDIFLDFEADPFVDEGGLEYLLGYVTLNDKQESDYTATWALDRAHERRMFESFIDMVMARRQHFPDLHIYHFSPYEPAALKRLMGRYATREDQIDRLLRAGVFVDLYRIVKQALRAGVETYSLKALEVFYIFERKTALEDAKHNLRHLEYALELNETANIPNDVCQTVEAYNREDCISTLRLRDWLEEIRREQVLSGKEIQRPLLEPGDPSEKLDERRKKALALMERLLHDVPDNPAERSSEQQAKWLLAYMLEWHRREDKATWWEYYRLCELTEEELLEERCAVAGLQFVKRLGVSRDCPTDRYRFPPQDTQVRRGDELKTSTGNFGTVEAIDIFERTLDVKKRRAADELHPTSVFVHDRIPIEGLEDSLFRLGTWVAENGVDTPGPYRAGRDLLLRNPLRPKTGVRPIQGPPGAGKTYKAARMICELLRDKKKVGITAVSHKVIRKLLDEVLDAAKKEGVAVRCIEKVTEKSKTPNPLIPETKDNDRVLAALQSGEAQVAAGTAWLWARPDFAESVDVLFVDEAGQMSLADVLAVSQGAQGLVLLGDPQQLEQPLQGTHPPGVDASALQHVLGTHETMPPELGLFLNQTWRLAPSICQFTSELFYENRLNAREGLERQTLNGPTRFPGNGLWFVPVAHEGNQSSSAEEAEVVAEIVNDLLQAGTSWTNSKGETYPLTLDHILIVAPYNAQVFKIAEHLPKKARIGTVDKFQGQEAPVVIYSMTTSSPEDAPRGMEFLYSANRFNVASSRARCACILVASPRLFEPECQTPRQMKLANVLCRYLEMASVSSLG
jgi:uncharacterized protein